MAEHEQRLDICASGHLGMRRLKSVSQLAPQNKRTCSRERISQGCALAQSRIEKGVAKVSPLSSILAPEPR